jgi:hypothetical protein
MHPLDDNNDLNDTSDFPQDKPITATSKKVHKVFFIEDKPYIALEKSFNFVEFESVEEEVTSGGDIVLHRRGLRRVRNTSG